MSAPSGKKGFCPMCGGPGTYVTNSFVTCDRRCEFEESESDGVPVEVDPDTDRTQVYCRHCGSDNVSKWGPEFRVNGRDYYQCHERTCGKGFQA